MQPRGQTRDCSLLLVLSVGVSKASQNQRRDFRCRGRLGCCATGMYLASRRCHLVCLCEGTTTKRTRALEVVLNNLRRQANRSHFGRVGPTVRRTMCGGPHTDRSKRWITYYMYSDIISSQMLRVSYDTSKRPKNVIGTRSPGICDQTTDDERP